MAENESTTDLKPVSFGGFKHGLTVFLGQIKDFFLAANGKIKTALLPLSSKFKIDADGNIDIDVTSPDFTVGDASETEKGVVQIGSGLSVNEGVISVATRTTLPAEDEEFDDADPAGVGYVNDKVASLVDGAPETLDTLKEIAEYLNGTDPDTAGGLVAQIASKANADDVYTKTDADDTFVKKGDFATDEEIDAMIADIFAA